MRKLFPFLTLGLAGVVGAGLFAVAGTSASAAGEDAYFKRDEAAGELVLVDDDDDDDTNDNTNSVNTGFSAATGDNTRSNFTRVSRDRDLSRSDKTRDWTRDGGDRTRDVTPNRTNDRSRNDTRGVRR